MTKTEQICQCLVVIDSKGVEYHSPGDFISSWVSIISYFAGSHCRSMNIILWCYMNFLWQGDVNRGTDYLSVLLFSGECCQMLLHIDLSVLKVWSLQTSYVSGGACGGDNHHTHRHIGILSWETFSFGGCLPAGGGFWWAITPTAIQGSELWSLDGKSIMDYFCAYWYSEVFTWELCLVRSEYAEHCQVSACWWWNMVSNRTSTGLQGSGRLWWILSVLISAGGSLMMIISVLSRTNGCLNGKYIFHGSLLHVSLFQGK